MYSMTMTKTALIIGGGIAGPVTAMALQRAGIDSVVYEAYGRGSDGVGAFLTLASQRAGSAGHPRPEGHGQRTWHGHTGDEDDQRAARNWPAQPMPARTVARTDLYADAARRSRTPRHRHRVRQASRRRRGHAGRRAGHVQPTAAPPRAICSSARTACARVPVPSSTRRPHEPGTSACSTPAGTRAACTCPAIREWPTSSSGGAASSATSSIPTARSGGSRTRPAAGNPAREELLGHHLRAVAGSSGRPVPRRHRGRCSTSSPPPRTSFRAGTPTTSRPCRPGTTTGWSSSGTPCTPPRLRPGRAPRWRSRTRSCSPTAFATSPTPRPLSPLSRALRQERVERVVKYGKRSGDGKAQGRVGARIRDLMMPMIVRKMVASNSLSWMYDYRIDWSAPVASAR